MPVTVRSFAKINLGLYIGSRRKDGFHELRTVYQTIALDDVIRVEVSRGEGIDIECDDSRVPVDSSNTCYRIAELTMEALGTKCRVHVEIQKRLPVQGGLGAASSNAVATMLALERALSERLSPLSKRGRTRGKILSAAEKLGIAADVGSDLPLFLVGGTVLGVGRGEEVYPLADLPSMPILIVTPEIGVSTPKAFANWDALAGQASAGELGSTRKGEGARPGTRAELTGLRASDRLIEVGPALSAWLCDNSYAGAPAKSGGRAGSLLSDLVRAGIGNDFEQVVFPEFPELRDMKTALKHAGARYVSLSGSGSTLYGLFESKSQAGRAARRLRKDGLKVMVTRTLTRREYWSKLGVSR